MAVPEEIVVLAGGFGTRLRDVVSDVPKPLAPVRGRPFLAYLLDAFAQQKLRRVIFATGYMGEVLPEALGRTWRGMDLVYVRESEPLGTGGAIAHAAASIMGDAFFVANGDTFLSLDYAAFAQFSAAHSVEIGVALANVPDVGRYGAVEIDGARIERFREKGGSGPGFINAGTYYVRCAALTAFPPARKFSFETDVLATMTGSGRMAGFTSTHDFIDIGVPEDYRRSPVCLGVESA
ncbi:nucleotidyltransferase family protein [Dyella sp. EPa41]|uniref:nucleotidyltransferase family protein n=1 Tax=Dyella sp. EPa41 TaxID=1561194 RepID=UPI0019160AFA|nr:nucleotidyltransferase family protein [Dyella sp. EPa41]